MMDENGNIEQSGSSRQDQGVIDRRIEADEDRELDGEIWKYCCKLSQKEYDFAMSNLHYAHVLRRQFTHGRRWFEISRLFAIETFQNKVGLVHRFECWMRKLDRKIENDGVFVGSNVKKYMVHPELGPIPLYKYW